MQELKESMKLKKNTCRLMSNIIKLKLPFGCAKNSCFFSRSLFFLIIQVDFNGNCPCLLLMLYKALGFFCNSAVFTEMLSFLHCTMFIISELLVN